jgi:hypothetical protein
MNNIFSEFIGFLLAVIEHWVAVMSGLVSILLGVHARQHRGRNVKNKTYFWIGLVFLFFATFLAWRDQVHEKESRVEAAKDKGKTEAIMDVVKSRSGLSETSQHSMTANGTNSVAAQVIQSTNVLIKNNSENPVSSIHNSPNSINTIGQSGGTNTLVVNAPEPYIYETKLLSINTPERAGAFYATKYDVFVANCSTNIRRLYFKKPPDKFSKIEIGIGRTALMGVGGLQPTMGVSFPVTILTIEEIREDDFSFSLKPL